jgi:hypothetical protein
MGIAGQIEFHAYLVFKQVQMVVVWKTASVNQTKLMGNLAVSVLKASAMTPAVSKIEMS